MDLILWRHAEANDGADDLDRPLSHKGEKQAAKMGDWLKRRLPEEKLVITSAALRTRQTAMHLTDEFVVDTRLNPGVAPGNYLAVCHWPQAEGTIVLVGHQPAIGRVASMLLAGIEADWAARKGAIWWIHYRIRDNQPQTVLRAVLSPDQL